MAQKRSDHHQPAWICAGKTNVYKKISAIDDVTLSFEELKALTLLFSSLFCMASSVGGQMKA